MKKGYFLLTLVLMAYALDSRAVSVNTYSAGVKVQTVVNNYENVTNWTNAVVYSYPNYSLDFALEVYVRGIMRSDLQSGSEWLPPMMCTFSITETASSHVRTCFITVSVHGPTKAFCDTSRGNACYSSQDQDLKLCASRPNSYAEATVTTSGYSWSGSDALNSSEPVSVDDGFWYAPNSYFEYATAAGDCLKLERPASASGSEFHQPTQAQVTPSGCSSWPLVEGFRWYSIAFSSHPETVSLKYWKDIDFSEGRLLVETSSSPWVANAPTFRQFWTNTVPHDIYVQAGKNTPYSIYYLSPPVYWFTSPDGSDCFGGPPIDYPVGDPGDNF